MSSQSAYELAEAKPSSQENSDVNIKGNMEHTVAE
jgi:hypothetical protein